MAYYELVRVSKDAFGAAIIAALDAAKEQDFSPVEAVIRAAMPIICDAHDRQRRSEGWTINPPGAPPVPNRRKATRKMKGGVDPEV